MEFYKTMMGEMKMMDEWHEEVVMDDKYLH